MKPSVSPGQPVNAGDTIGVLDSSGCQSHAHLHVGRKDPNGTLVNFTIPCVNPTPVLEGRYGSVDLKEACAPELRRIRQAPGQGAALELVRTPWANCVWFHVRDADIGEYPQRVWNSFLASKGVKEHLIVIEE